MGARQPVISSVASKEAVATVIRNQIVRLWRLPGVNRALNAAVTYTPSPTRRWIEHQRAVVRQTELQKQIRQRSRLVPQADFRALLHRGFQALIHRHGRESLGDYLEFGVYNGTSLLGASQEVKALGLVQVRLFGFDSFQGFPPAAAHQDEGRWRPGKCHAPLEFTTAVLEAEGVDWERVTLVPGWFSDTLNAATIARHGIRKASVIMIDCDLYSSTLEALRFCAPLIEDEALILFDEYYPRGLEEKDIGEKRAFREFLADHPMFEATSFGTYANRAATFLVSRR